MGFVPGPRPGLSGARSPPDVGVPAVVAGRPLSERFRPRGLGDLVGNASAVREIRKWGADWRNAGTGAPRFRAALFEGPPGVGKTSAALALAHEMGWSLVEMNASDARNQEAIQQVAGRASVSATLGGDVEYRSARDGGRTLILLDEADCLTGRAGEEARRPPTASLREFLRGRYGTIAALNGSWGLGAKGGPPAFADWGGVPATAGRAGWTRLSTAQRDLSDWKGGSQKVDSSDRGGLGAIARLVRSTRQPLVLTVNDPGPLYRYSPVFRQSVKRISFGPIPGPVIAEAIDRVLAAEKVHLPPAVRTRILERSQGDLRAALTDAEAVAVLPTPEAAKALFGARDLSAQLEEFAREVFARPRYYRSAEVQQRTDGPPDDLFPWIQENVPRAAPDPAARLAGLETAAAAEWLLARARRFRVWSLWSFASEVMTGGVSTAISAHAPARSGEMVFPVFLSEMGRSRANRAMRTAVATKAGHAWHLSRRKFLENVLPELDRLLRPPGRALSEGERRLAREILEELELTPDEAEFLLGDEAALLAELRPPAPEVEPDVIEEAPPPAEPVAPAPAVPEGRKKVQRRLAEF